MIAYRLTLETERCSGKSGIQTYVLNCSRPHANCAICVAAGIAFIRTISGDTVLPPSCWECDSTLSYQRIPIPRAASIYSRSVDRRLSTPRLPRSFHQLVHGPVRHISEGNASVALGRFGVVCRMGGGSTLLPVESIQLYRYSGMVVNTTHVNRYCAIIQQCHRSSRPTAQYRCKLCGGCHSHYPTDRSGHEASCRPTFSRSHAGCLSSCYAPRRIVVMGNSFVIPRLTSYIPSPSQQDVPINTSVRVA